MSDVNRRTILKGIGAMAGVGLGGVGVGSAADNQAGKPDINRRETQLTEQAVTDALNQKETEIVMDEAPPLKLQKERATGYQITVVAQGIKRTFSEVVIPSGDEDSGFSHVKSPDTASVATIKTDGTVFRAVAEDDGIRTEILELDTDVTAGAVRSLQQRDRAIGLDGVATLHTDRASAAYDRVSETTRLYVPATESSGDTDVVYAEISDSGSVDDVYVIQQDYWPCVSGCIALHATSIGYYCWSLGCGPCAAGVLPSCGVCLGCVGWVGTVCTTSCA